MNYFLGMLFQIWKGSTCQGTQLLELFWNLFALMMAITFAMIILPSEHSVYIISHWLSLFILLMLVQLVIRCTGYNIYVFLNYLTNFSSIWIFRWMVMESIPFPKFLQTTVIHQGMNWDSLQRNWKPSGLLLQIFMITVVRWVLMVHYREYSYPNSAWTSWAPKVEWVSKMQYFVGYCIHIIISHWFIKSNLQEVIRKYTEKSKIGKNYASLASSLGSLTWQKPSYSDFQLLARYFFVSFILF